MGGAAGGLDLAALRETPAAVRKSWRVWCAVVWASYCGALHGFNTSNISGVMSLAPFVRDFGFNKMSSSAVSNLQGWVVSAMLLGQLAGVIFSGPVGEVYGRKPVIMIAAILYIIGAILMSANFGSVAELLVGRVISGLGSGFGMTVGAVYISEIAPRALRGCMGAIYNVNIMMGVTAAYFINYASKIHLNPASSWQWRAALVLQAIPAVALLAGYPFFPESPRFLVLKDKSEEALASLCRLRNLPSDHEYVVEEFNEFRIRAAADAELPGAGQRSPVARQWQAAKELVRYCAEDRSTRQRVFFVIFIQTAFIMCGGNSITYYAPNILKIIGLNPNQVLLFTATYGCIKVASVLLYAFFLTDRFGRRPLLLIGSITNLLCTLYLSVFLGVANIQPGAPTTPAAWVAIVAICIFAIGYGFGWAPAFSLSTSEICPTRTRGIIVTLAFAYQNLLNFGITRAFPNMVASMHAYGPFALFTACTVVSTAWVYVAFPECKGRNMEDMDALFYLPWYKVGRASLRATSTVTDDEKVDSTEIVETKTDVYAHVE
ncbi:General substrate transporter [Niveomyces insectorum RCEF 264]|uniref:General substrate transporter n=1 Tax=Niveomyces insectorum RCEF 264 TaxID=1081102 RepID=A0A167T7P7_9HYPO|nr:General substrate transporter [Niveomyces insectorum RCEF 264]